MNKIFKLTSPNLYKYSFQHKKFHALSHIFPFHTLNTMNLTKHSVYNSSRKKSFCNLNKLDIDKLALDKLDDKPININTINDISNFNKEDNIIEFGPETKWEETVLNSDIPVVVDCYAK